MSPELSNASSTQSRKDTRPGSLSPTTSTGNVTANTPQEDKEYLSSLSQNSSSKLASILLSPSGRGDARPRSSEGRVSSLNLPKDLPHPSRQTTSMLGPSRRRVSAPKMDGKAVAGVQVDFNFGMDDYALEPEDPQVVEDVQRALKAKALHEARAKLENSDQASSKASSQVDMESPSRASTSAALPKLLIPGSTRNSISTPPRITFPTHEPSPSRSLESLSSEGRLTHAPIPILMVFHDGSTYLDWSGSPPETIDHPSEKDKSLFGRKFSTTRRKSKEKDRLRWLSGRKSSDLGTSQGDLHAARLDSIRRTAKRDTLSRAAITKDELSRQYAAFACHQTTIGSSLNILRVAKSRKSRSNTQVPWMMWTSRRITESRKPTIWTVTADSLHEHLQASGCPPVHATLSATTGPSAGHLSSATYDISSQFSSPRSSLSLSPIQNDNPRTGRQRMELGRSFSANPIIEGVSSMTSPLSPTLSRSLSLTQAPTHGTLTAPSTAQRRSIDVMMGAGPAAVSFTNLNDSPRSSLDRTVGSPPQQMVEKESLGKRVRVSLSGDKVIPMNESRTSTMSSLTNLFSPGHGNSNSTNSRRHLGVGNMFGRIRRSGEESADGRNERSRSSISDERDSGRDGEGSKGDDLAIPTKFERDRIASLLNVRDIRLRGKDTLNTSDSEFGGPFSGKFGRRFWKSEKDAERGRSVDEALGEVARHSVSETEQREVDMLAAPGWTTKRGVRQARMTIPKEVEQEKLQETLRKREEQEERVREIYQTREVMLLETNDHNRRMARLLKAVNVSIRKYEEIQADLAQATGSQPTRIPAEVLEAISADPATTLRHGKGWRAVEASHQQFIEQQALLTSYLSTPLPEPVNEDSSELGDAIQEAEQLWRELSARSQQIDKHGTTVKAALRTAVAHMNSVQKEYNDTQILVETDYPEQSQIADLETIIVESLAPRGWLEFAAFWIPELVLEAIGSFIRFFGVPISEKFIRPFLWYFFRNRYYWKIYSTEPPPSERAWYTRLAYWVVILSILAWYTTA